MDSKHPKEERTVVIIKPDGVKRGLVGEVIKRIEARGLKVIALGMMQATHKQMDEHYPISEAWIRRLGEKTLATYEKYGYDAMAELNTKDPLKIGKMVRGWLIDYMTAAPLVKMIVKGTHAIDMVRKLGGNTMPALSEMGTIRGDFSVDSAAAANKDKRAVHNILHASETSEEAEHEIEHWFSPKEIHNYKRAEEDLML